MKRIVVTFELTSGNGWRSEAENVPDLFGCGPTIPQALDSLLNTMVLHLAAEERAEVR